MKSGLIKLLPNRVRRNYLGGKGIDELHSIYGTKDNDKPEEWVGSLVEATNPGMEVIPHEGLAKGIIDNKEEYLKNIIDSDPSYYLGSSIHKDGTYHMSFLYKILDSAMRLHVQVHPTSQFAREKMGKPYGKLECYFILGVREGYDPYIRLGFQHAPSKEEWKEIVEKQDIKRTDACFEKIPVKVGEVWYIPGGMPHAIGEGFTLLEIMEPSDLVVRCEFEREGIVVPPAGRFMNLGIDFCLDIFDYTSYSKEEIAKKCKIEPKVIKNTESYTLTRLIDEKQTPCFFVEKLEINKPCEIVTNSKFNVGVVLEGNCKLIGDDGSVLELQRGDSFVIAASLKFYKVDLEKKVEFAFVYPGKDMEG